MKLGYIRISKTGPSLDEQKSILSTAGVDVSESSEALFIDNQSTHRRQHHLPKRLEAINNLSQGDFLVVSSGARLGSSIGDILDALDDVDRRRAAVLDAETGTVIEWHPDAMKVIKYARRAESEIRKEIAQKMRSTRVALGTLGGPPEKLTNETLSQAQKLWSDKSLTASQVAERVGVSVRTLYRRLGERSSF